MSAAAWGFVGAVVLLIAFCALVGVSLQRARRRETALPPVLPAAGWHEPLGHWEARAASPTHEIPDDLELRRAIIARINHEPESLLTQARRRLSARRRR